MLADYFFGTFGPVTPVRGHDDYGLDLYCAWSERMGNRSLPREYFSVQVKSTDEGWSFNNPDEVRWLIEHANPVLLCVVNKQAGYIEVFHTFGRFTIPPYQVPARLVLRPGKGNRGSFCRWDPSGEIDLSAPIIRASVTEFYDDDRHEQFSSVLANWLRHERLNLDYRRMGVMRYRMPPEYATNEPAAMSMQESGMYPPHASDFYLGIRRLAEAADCIGDQLRFLRDMKGAVRAALLVDYLRSTFPDAGDDSFWSLRFQGHLVPDVVKRLRLDGDTSLTDPLDALQQEVDLRPRIAGALESAEIDEDPFSFAPRKPRAVSECDARSGE